MTTINEINQTIISGQFTDDQLSSIIQAVKFARSQLVAKARTTLVKGSTVKFVNRAGKTEIGVVDKVNRKFIMVRVGVTTWRVPGNMLTAA